MFDPSQSFPPLASVMRHHQQQQQQHIQPLPQQNFLSGQFHPLPPPPPLPQQQQQQPLFEPGHYPQLQRSFKRPSPPTNSIATMTSAQGPRDPVYVSTNNMITNSDDIVLGGNRNNTELYDMDSSFGSTTSSTVSVASSNFGPPLDYSFRNISSLHHLEKRYPRQSLRKQRRSPSGTSSTSTSGD